MNMTAEVVLEEGTRWRGIAGSGHSLAIDGPVEAGGLDAGFRPMELMLLSLGGCMGYDMITILRRMRQEVTGYRLRLMGERSDDPPAVYTSVRLEHLIVGKGLEPDKVERALALAADRYCSAWAMFARTAKLSNSFRIENEK